MSTPSYKLSEIAERIGGEVVGRADTVISGVAPLRSAGPGEISFLASAKPALLDDLAASAASAVVVRDPAAAPGRNLIVVADVVESFDRILALFPTPQGPPPAGVHSGAWVDPSADLAAGVAVGPGVVIQAGVRIGQRTVLYPNVFVGPQCVIGADCVLYPGVVLRERTELGSRVVLHPNVVIGSDGFGYRTDKAGVHHKVPQVGRVVIEDDVEVGANTTIDRAKFGATRIGRGAKIDNLCQIAHNVQIGEGCLIAALAGIAGSTVLEHHVVLAGHTGIRDNIRLGAGTIITAFSGLSHSTEPGAVLSGQYGEDHRTHLRLMALTRRLPELFERVDQLAERLEALDRAAADDSTAG